MDSKLIYILIGTRPNFIKVTQFRRISASNHGIEVKLIHTGQHYDAKMADVFFEQFGMYPDYFLETPPGSPNKQIAEIMIRLESLFEKIEKPDYFLVPGDVNSTLAGAITANKMGIKLGHIESGLRSFDRSMPEEINRILTDQISDYYFVTEQSGLDLIQKENLSGKAFFVGNTMIDTLVHFDKEIEESSLLKDHNLKKKNFILMTMHRPATVDNKIGLNKILDLLQNLTRSQTVLFPVHPRTKAKLELFGLWDDIQSINNLIITGPMDYFAFQKAIKYAKVIITDSGGIQEESTYRQVPCLTLRPNTERPSTIDIGSNTLVVFDIDLISKLIEDIEEGKYKLGTIPPLWDGKSTERIIQHLIDL